MGPNQFKSFEWRTSGLGIWVVMLLVLVLVGSLVPDWLINTILIIMGLVFLAPILAFVGLRWWLQRSVIQGNCPVCDYPLSSLKQLQVQCPSCGELLKVNSGRYERMTPPGTVDVEVIDVSDS